MSEFLLKLLDVVILVLVITGMMSVLFIKNGLLTILATLLFLAFLFIYEVTKEED